MLTFKGLAYACHDYPEMVENIAFKIGPIVSPNFFRDVVMPRYKRIAKKLHAADIDIWYTDCDGEISQLLPYFWEAGINTMFSFEVNGSGHSAELLDKYGEK